MPVRSRDHLAQLDAVLTPVFNLIAITKIIRRTRTIEHDELTKLLFSFQHVAQRRTQRRDARSHRHKNKVTPFHPLEVEAVSRDSDQLDLISGRQVINDRASAG